jgi:hypothetical protein
LNFGSNSSAENITFSNLILRDVTGPINVGIDNHSRRRWESGAPAKRTPGVVRNIAFRGIRATIVPSPAQQADMPFPPHGRPGETRTCIVLNGAGDAVLENISLSDIQVFYPGGGTADEAAREVPQVAGEYFEIGTPPAHGLYARHVRGLTLDNVRFETATPDLRPAVVFDGVTDAAVSSLNIQGNPQALSALRIIDSRDTLLTAPRLLTQASVFLRAEGASTGNIKLDGGDLSKAATPFFLGPGVLPSAVAVRS